MLANDQLQTTKAGSDQRAGGGPLHIMQTVCGGHRPFGRNHGRATSMDHAQRCFAPKRCEKWPFARAGIRPADHFRITTPGRRERLSPLRIDVI